MHAWRLVTALLVGLAAATAGAQTSTPPDGLPAIARLQDYAAYRSSSSNPDPRSNDDSLRPIPGETAVLAELPGPGLVTHLWITVADDEYAWPRLLRLRVYYDGSPVPSVDTPLGDFFGSGLGLQQPLESLVVRASSSGRSRNCYWPMPFRRSCRITVTNEGVERVSNLYYHVDWRRVPSLPPDTAYFHARYHQELPVVAGRDYPVLDVRGRGHYVGTVFSVIQAEPGWFGEGDERIFVDGATEPSIIGTGTEDYFNDAWSLRVDTGPYAGVTVAEGTGLGSRMTAYRWHLPDPIPFTSSFRFDLEHNGWTFNPDGGVRSASGERADLFSSVAFWYQQGIAQGLPQVPFGAARLPHGNALKLETEEVADEVVAAGGSVRVLPSLFWGTDVLLLDAVAPGATFDVPFEVPAAGRYELSVLAAHSVDYGNWSTRLDGRSTAAAAIEHEPGATVLGNQIRGYFHETYVGSTHLLGWFELAAGHHVLRFVCDGKDPASSGYGLGVDGLVLARVGESAWPGAGGLDPAAEALRAVGELPAAQLDQHMDEVLEATAAGDPELRQAAVALLIERGRVAAVPVATFRVRLADPDPVVRGLAAIALRDLGPAAAPALAGLTAALEDGDENVRLAAANAIAAQGPAAAAAVPQLIAACRVDGEVVHVQRALAAALGAIGPAAAPALPVLRELAAIPRVSWPAEAAIRAIGGDI